MTQTFLIATARDVSAAAATGLPCGHLCYRISTGGTLQRTRLPPSTRGGLMGFFDASGLVQANADLLARNITAEYRRRGYVGILLDCPIDAHDTAFAALCRTLHLQNIPIFARPSAAAVFPGCRVILPGTLSGGTFDDMLDFYKAQYSTDRICLDLQRCCHSFSMPSDTPDGHRLTPQELQTLLQTQPRIFFSPELCTRYFTYRADNGQLQFVLLDDPDTAAGRLRRAKACGIRSFLLLYSEWGQDAKAIAQS